MRESVPETKDIEPRVEQVEFPGKLLTSLEDVKSRLSNVPFYSFQLSPAKLQIARVESRNVRKKPFLFYIIEINKERLILTYSIIPETSERLRRATVIQNLASLLAIVNDAFHVDDAKFLQYVDSVMDNLLAGMSLSYSTLFNKYDSLLNEYVETKRLLNDITVSNRNLTIQTSQLSEENKSLGDQLKQLQSYSDEALMTMVQDWITVHNSSIDIGEFSKAHNVPEPRVEQILDRMASMGYIELKG